MSELDLLRRQIARLDHELLAALIARRQAGRAMSRYPDGCVAQAVARGAARQLFRDARLTQGLCRCYLERLRHDYVGQVVAHGSARMNPEVKPSGLDHLDQCCLRLILKRMGHGVRVAQAKARQEPARFKEAIRQNDQAALWRQITHADIEQRVYERVRCGVRSLGVRGTAGVEAWVQLYQQWLIPLTKAAEVSALLGWRGPCGDHYEIRERHETGN
jgi:chorismate mutase